MEIQLNKIFKILWLLLFFITCKGQDDKPTKQQEKKHTKENKIDFLDKKYFSLYSLDANNKIPTMSYYDKKIGQFTLYYLGKNKELQQLWDNFDSKNNLTYEEAPDENYYNNLNKLISQKLNISNYDIFSEYITPQYLKIEKDELLYSYPLIKKIYKYQKENHKWLLIKEEKIVSNTNIITLNYLNKLNNTQNLIDQDDYEKTVDTDKKYQTILLYKHLKNGINKNNIKDISTVEKIETVKINYILNLNIQK